MGIDLFEITPRGLKPNNIGRVYGTQIRKTLEQAKLAFDLARYEAALQRRPFSVGHSRYIHGDLLPLLEKITLPGSEAAPVVLRSAPTMQLVRRVRNGELQAVLAYCRFLIKTSGSNASHMNRSSFASQNVTASPTMQD